MAVVVMLGVTSTRTVRSGTGVEKERLNEKHLDPICISSLTLSRLKLLL
jgi:hypothetical protein